MIKATELRIGNAIWDDTRNKVRFVTHRIISDIASSAEPLPYSPIPLNAEWLVKFGFVKDEQHECFVIWQAECEVEVSYDDDGVSIAGCTMADALEHIKFVHQLQNLYFALTGGELTIKEAV